MIDPKTLLGNLPSGLRTPLFATYQEIISNYSEHRWEPSELNGGKFCEVVYTIIHGTLNGSFATSPSKPNNMVSACRALEQLSPDLNRVGDRSLRILIPRTLPVLYEIRNNRGVGHIGGDVNPNFLDSTAVLGMASWVLAELVRIFHNVSTKEAQETVDALIERKTPLIWEVGDVKRVLDPKMKKIDQTLLFLHQLTGWVVVSKLVRWVEYSSENMFKKRILQPLHEKRQIEFDQKANRAKISPLGINIVEKEILKSRS